MQLSDFFDTKYIPKDGFFDQLDAADSTIHNSLTFCQDLLHLQPANLNQNISSIIATPKLSNEITQGKGVVISDNPRFSFFELYNILTKKGLNQPEMDFGIGINCNIHPTAVISPKTKIGDNVVIGPYSVIEDFSNIADNTYIASGVTVGAEGLLTVEDNNLRILVKHAGGVEIGSNVVILSNSVIAKSVYHSFTKIGDYTQIGILSSIGHGARIGQNCIVSGNCLIAGRVHIGDNTRVGLSSSIAQNVKIGMNVQIKMGSVVVEHAPRHEGKPNYTLAKQFRLALDNICNVTVFPLRVVTFLGLAACMLSLGLTVFFLIRYFAGGIHVGGWTSIVVLISVFSGIILLSLGIIGEYLVRVLREVRGFPGYIECDWIAGPKTGTAEEKI